MGNYPLTNESKKFLANITTIKHLICQSTKFCADLSMLFNVFVQFLVPMLAQKRFLISEMLFNIFVKGIQGIKCCSESFPFAHPKFKSIQAYDKLRVLLVDFLNANLRQLKL